MTTHADEARRIVEYHENQSLQGGWDLKDMIYTIETALAAAERRGIMAAAHEINRIRFTDYAVVGCRLQWQAALELEMAVRLLATDLTLLPAEPDPATAPIAEVRAELERRGIDVGPATERVLAAVHAAKPEPNRVYWFAETLANSGEYATRGRPGHPCAMTRDPLQAARFETRHECIEFCCGTTVRAILPPLHPVEHMFMDRDVAEPAAKCARCNGSGVTSAPYELDAEDCPSCGGAR